MTNPIGSQHLSSHGQPSRTDPLTAAPAVPSASGSPGAASGDVQQLEPLLSPAVRRRLGVCRLPPGFLLSVVVPVYNEVATLEELVCRVRAAGVPSEIIVVDDGSTDGTSQLLKRMLGPPWLKVLTHPSNRGKGAALRTGLGHVQGNVVILQDADLEYDPGDYPWLLEPIIEGRTDVVYGSRFSSNDRPVWPFWHQNGNRLITLLSNMLTNLKLTDVETCYKVIRRELVDAIAPTLQENGFGVELEITAKLARQPGVRFYERPISYTRPAPTRTARKYARATCCGPCGALFATDPSADLKPWPRRLRGPVHAGNNRDGNMPTTVSRKPTRKDLKPGEVLCEYCTAKCCRYFALPIDTPTDVAAISSSSAGTCCTSVPRVFTEEGTGICWCTPRASICRPTHRCGIYADPTPQICREYSTRQLRIRRRVDATSATSRPPNRSRSMPRPCSGPADGQSHPQPANRRCCPLSTERAEARMIPPRTLKGFRDYLPEAMMPRERLIDTARASTGPTASAPSTRRPWSTWRS